MQKRIKTTLLLTALFCLTVQLNAQNQLSSPYSRFGLGELTHHNSYTNIAMGGVSYAHKQATSINYLNPASYTAFDSISCLVDAAFSYKYHALQENTTKQSGGTITFDYLALGLSVVPRWNTVFGFHPYSFVNYTINESESWNDTIEVSKAFSGVGGLYEFYWGNAIQIFKNFSLGCNISYLFGYYDKIRTMEFSDNLFLNYKNDDKITVNGALFSFGAQYFIPIKKHLLGLGLTYSPSIPTVFGNQSDIMYTYVNTTSGESVVDTLYWNGNEKITITLPQTIGTGISWSSEKYFLGFDFTWSDWSQYKMGDILDTLKDSYKYALGGSIIPNPTGSKYISKIRYSFGGYYEITPLYLKENQLDRFGINFGLSFPMKKSKTRFNVCFEYGKWGNLQNNLVQETYFITSFNIALHERWYQRRKLD